MAVQSLESLLGTLTSSLETANSTAPEKSSLNPPAEELSLLTTKNEFFLSYIHNLVFLIMVKLQHATSRDEQGGKSDDDKALDQEATEKLAELRLYLEKGVKPLETRLKYQVDKVIRAAEEASGPQTTMRSSHAAKTRAQVDVSGSDISNEPSGAEDGSSEDEADLAAAPNQVALLRTSAYDTAQTSTGARIVTTGIYKPPKITPTALPTTQGREPKPERRAGRSAALDEFIADEFSTAPVVEPSIGSTIRAGGRHTLSQRERDKDAEKRRYEEENFVRLPAATKKERAKMPKPSRGNAFGGEEWQNLGRGLDRIDRLTQRGSSGRAANVLARSRKRAVQDGPRDSGDQSGVKRHKAARR